MSAVRKKAIVFKRSFEICFYLIQWIAKLKYFFYIMCLYYTYHLSLIQVEKLTYPFLIEIKKKKPTSLQISWSLHIFSRVCCLVHSSHSSSGSAHVLQKCVALTWIFLIEHISHSTSLLCWLFSLYKEFNLIRIWFEAMLKGRGF